jgi:hypothetical protein
MNNDRVPYTYLVRHKPSGKLYYGCRFAKGCNPEDLWKTYFTSSRHVKKLIEESGRDSFEVEIRKVFSGVEECRIWEHRVLTRMKVIRREDFLNRSNNKSVHPDDARKGALAQTGKPKNHSVEGIERIRTANSVPYKDRDWSEETKMRVKNKIHATGYTRPPETFETRNKKSESHKGKSSGMLGKNQLKCSCTICREELNGASGLASHHRYKHLGEKGISRGKSSEETKLKMRIRRNKYLNNGESEVFIETYEERVDYLNINPTWKTGHL